MACQQKPRRSRTALFQGGLWQTFICTLSKLTYSGVFVQCTALGKALPTQSTWQQAWLVFNVIYCKIAIELGVFPVLYVMRGFKLPLLTPNA